MMAKMPWEFSKPGRPEDGIPNLPCEAGAALGRELARFAAHEEARQRVEFPKMPPMCDECLCRLGTAPNRTATSLMDLVKCIQEGEPFYCHKGVADGDEPKRLCAGYVLLATSGGERIGH